MTLRGKRVLVVEDDALICMMIEDFLGELGCQVVATAALLDEAVRKARVADVDVAVLDINLAGQLSYPVASVLGTRQIPFLFATGYGLAGLPLEFAGVELIAKPFNLQQLEMAMKRSTGKWLHS